MEATRVTRSDWTTSSAAGPTTSAANGLPPELAACDCRASACAIPLARPKAATTPACRCPSSCEGGANRQDAADGLVRAGDSPSAGHCSGPALWHICSRGQTAHRSLQPPARSDCLIARAAAAGGRAGKAGLLQPQLPLQWLQPSQTPPSQLPAGTTAVHDLLAAYVSCETDSAFNLSWGPEALFKCSQGSARATHRTETSGRALSLSLAEQHHYWHTH